MGKRILIADDEPHMAAALKTLLEGEGYDVDLVRDGRAALEALGPEYALLIVDVTLPGMNGYEVAQAARQTFPAGSLHIIVISTKIGQFSPQKALALGADAYLKKPFTMAALLREIRGFVGDVS